MGKFSRLARALWEESIAAMSDDSVQRIEEALNGAYQAGVKAEHEAILFEVEKRTGYAIHRMDAEARQWDGALKAVAEFIRARGEGSE